METDVPTGHKRTQWRRLVSSVPQVHGLGWLGTFALIVVAGFMVVAAIGPTIVGDAAFDQSLTDAYSPPSLEHPMGTDQFGRDVLARIVFGTRWTAGIAIGAAGLALVIGTPIGLLAGYRRGVLDSAVMRVVDVMLAFPGIIIALVLAAVLGAGGLNVVVGVGVFFVPTYMRLVRGMSLSASQDQYVEAAKALGATDSRTIAGDILPNIAGPLLAQLSISVAQAILIGSALSFLGLGVPLPIPEWGAMLSEARDAMRRAPYTAVFPGLAVMIVVFAFNVLGDRIHSRIDPTGR